MTGVDKSIRFLVAAFGSLLAGVCPPAEAVAIDDSVAFTTSPTNGNAGRSPYTFTAAQLGSFDPAGSDKLILTVSSERAESVVSITYAGVALDEVVSGANGRNFTAIYYLDDPPAAGDLRVEFSGNRVRGVGGSLLAVSGTVDGFGTVNTRNSQVVTLGSAAGGSLVVGAHVNDGDGGLVQPPFVPVFNGPVGSAGGGSGYAQPVAAGPISAEFTGNAGWPESVIAEFLPGAVIDEGLRIAITRTDSGYDLSWNSRPDKVYELVSSPDLGTAPETWRPHEGDAEEVSYENIPSGGTTTTVYGVTVTGSRRFFAVLERDPPPPGLGKIRVFLLGGQSNADGYGDPGGLPTSPVNLQEPQDDVDVYYRIAYGGAGLTTLRPGISQHGGFGPEVTFGRSLSDALAGGGGSRVALIKYANGGTSLQDQWHPGGDGTTNGDGPDYRIFQTTVTNGMAAFAAAYPDAVVTIEGMLWVQGETDITNGFAGNYESNLTTFIADVRATFGANLPFVITRLSDNQTALDAGGLATVRSAQVSVADADPFAAWVDTDGFGMRSDELHFDAVGQQQLGSASAPRLLSLIP